MRKIIQFSLILLLIGFVSLAVAKTEVKPDVLQVYEKPSVSAKVIDVIHPGSTIIPIFQKNDWVKIGNPMNGQVGWVEKKVLKRGSFFNVQVRTFYHGPARGPVISDEELARDKVKMRKMIRKLNRQRKRMHKAIKHFMQEGLVGMERLNRRLEHFLETDEDVEMEGLFSDERDESHKTKSIGKAPYEKDKPKEKSSSWWEGFKAKWRGKSSTP